MDHVFVWTLRDVVLLAMVFVYVLAMGILWAGHLLGRLLEWRPAGECEDCALRTNDLTLKGDHHGGIKRVCRDRNACHTRCP